MAWNLRTWLFGETITAAKLNEIRDALLDCAPGKVSGAGQIPVGVGANELAGLDAPAASLLSLVSDLADAKKMKWGSAIAGAAVQRTTDQTTAAVSYILSFTSELFDTNGFVDLGANADRITIPAGLDGIYLVGGHIDFENDDSTGGDYDRGFSIEPNNGTGSAVTINTVSKAVWEAIHDGTSGYDNERDQMTVVGLMGLTAGNYLRHYSWAGNSGQVDRKGSMWAIRLMAIPS